MFVFVYTVGCTLVQLLRSPYYTVVQMGEVHNIEAIPSVAKNALPKKVGHEKCRVEKKSDKRHICSVI